MEDDSWEAWVRHARGWDQKYHERNEERHLFFNVDWPIVYKKDDYFPDEDVIARKFHDQEFCRCAYLTLKTITRPFKDYFVHLYLVVRVAQEFLEIAQKRIHSTDPTLDPTFAEHIRFSNAFECQRIFNCSQTSLATLNKVFISPWTDERITEFFTLYRAYCNSHVSHSTEGRKIVHRVRELDYTLNGSIFFLKYLYACRPIVLSIGRDKEEYKSMCTHFVFTYMDGAFFNQLRRFSEQLREFMAHENIPLVYLDFVEKFIGFNKSPLMPEVDIREMIQWNRDYM